MRTLACVLAATTAAVSVLAAALEPAVWPVAPAIGVSLALVAVLVIVQWRSGRAQRVPGRHRRSPPPRPPEALGEPASYGYAGESITTGEIDVRPALEAGMTVVHVAEAYPAAMPARRAIRNAETDPFVALVPGAAAVPRPPWQHWSPALDRRLLGLFDETTSTGEIAIRMRRDRDTVDHRLVQLLVDAAADFSDEPPAPRHREPMPEAEAAYLRTAMDRGESLRRMARAVGRTQIEVGRFLVERRRLTVR